MRDRLRQDLAVAIKARDRVAIAALRTTLASIDNAEAVDLDATGPGAASSQHVAGASTGAGSSDVAPRILTDADVVALVREQIEERRQAAAEYDSLGRAEQAEILRREASILTAYITTAS